LQLSSKQNKLTDLENTTHEARKEMYQNEQLHDRLRHYEAQAQLVESLGRELHNSQVNNILLFELLIKITFLFPCKRLP
jgi:polynucleotide 5'-kinase involved in rRNA processing